MTAKEKLEKAHWVRVSYKKHGMIRIAKWHDPKTGQVWSQSYALSILKNREAIAKQTRETAKQQAAKAAAETPVQE